MSTTQTGLPPTIWATIIAVAFSALFALLGIIYHSLKSSINDNEVETSTIRERQLEMSKRVRTIFFWAFGAEGDSTDKGFADDIQGKLADLNENIEQIAEDEDEHHEVVVERLDEVILKLDDEEALEFDRDDIE